MMTHLFQLKTRVRNCGKPDLEAQKVYFSSRNVQDKFYILHKTKTIPMEVASYKGAEVLF